MTTNDSSNDSQNYYQDEDSNETKNFSVQAATETQSEKPAEVSTWASIKLIVLYFLLYFAGIGAFLIIISEPIAMRTYFSDNSLLPGLVNREFSLVTEAEYYVKILEKLTNEELVSHKAQENDKQSQYQRNSLATLPSVSKFLKNELDNFGLEVHEQNFSYMNDGKQINGTNLYSIIRAERSTSSESIALCAPFKRGSKGGSLSNVALTLALAKYFSNKSYWAKDVIILLVDREEHGLSAWLDSYYDINFRQDIRRLNHQKTSFYYDSLPDRSGPLQAAIVLELNGKQFTRVNLKIQGMYGQLPNLDLFNLVVELAARESVTPYFHNKSLPYGFQSDMELFKHHLETAMSFIQTQATMKSDGLHGLFLRYAVQSLTIEAPEHQSSDKHLMIVSLLNIGRLVEGVFRSLNNLTERFNRSFYFYIIVSLRRFTSIGYYMIAFGLLVSPILVKAFVIHTRSVEINKLIGARAILLLASALVLSILSTFNISAAFMVALVLVPVLSVI